MKKLSCIVSILYVIAAVLFTATFSIGLPIYARQFYFSQIDDLELEKESGATKEQIKESYNELIDYLTIPNAEFSTGVFEYSEEGKSHFEDCKHLFLLNGTVLLISAAFLAAAEILDKTKKLPLARRDLLAIAGGTTLSVCTVLTVLVAIDFDRAFTAFHKLFFAGKDNWVFDSETDEIIKILPADFFANCAILIGAGIIVLSVLFIVIGIVKKRIFTK